MTIRGLGRVVPSQLCLLHLAGVVITKRNRLLNPPDEMIDNAREDGYLGLRQMTGEDFGYDVLKWYDYLMEHQSEYGITHPYGYQTMCQILHELGYEVQIDPKTFDES